jgi:hypothetical protein
MAAGRDHLAGRLAGRGLDRDPAMWHDKDLYRPDAVVHAAVLAALAMARDALGEPTAAGQPRAAFRSEV